MLLVLIDTSDYYIFVLVYKEFQVKINFYQLDMFSLCSKYTIVLFTQNKIQFQLAEIYVIF